MSTRDETRQKIVDIGEMLRKQRMKIESLCDVVKIYHAALLAIRDGKTSDPKTDAETALVASRMLMSEYGE